MVLHYVENLKFENCMVCSSTSDFVNFIYSLVNDGICFYVDWVHDSEQGCVCVVYY